MAEPQMAHAADKGERYCVGDIAADDALRRQMRIESGEHRHADGAGANRGQRHEEAQGNAEQNRDDRVRRVLSGSSTLGCLGEKRIKNQSEAA